MAVNFSNLYQHAKGMVQYSPDGALLAIVVGTRLVLRDPLSFEIVQLYSCIDKIEAIEWSPDSAYILCCCYKHKMVQVFSRENPDWYCRIDEGITGLTEAMWCPDSRHILTFAEFNLQLTLWSLSDQQAYIIKHPKGGRETVSFTSDGRYLAVACRKECKDFISIFAQLNAPWTEVASFFTRHTLDLASLLFAPDASAVIAIDCPLQFRVAVFSLSGELIRLLELGEGCLGVKSVALAPSGDYLALGTFSSEVVLVSTLSWVECSRYPHEHPRLLQPCYKAPPPGERSVPMFSQVRQHGETVGRSRATAKRQVRTRQERRERAEEEEGAQDGSSLVVKRNVSSIPTDPVHEADSKALERSGVGLLAWSPDGQFLASRVDQSASTLWLWHVSSTGLSLTLTLLAPIRSFKWLPHTHTTTATDHHHTLAVVSGTSSVFFWSDARQGEGLLDRPSFQEEEEEEEGGGSVTWLDIPSDTFKAMGLRWQEGSCLEGGPTLLTLLSRDRLCSAVFQAPSLSEERKEEAETSLASNTLFSTDSPSSTPLRRSVPATKLSAEELASILLEEKENDDRETWSSGSELNRKGEESALRQPSTPLAEINA